MKSHLPKVLQPLCGQAMISHVIQLAQTLHPKEGVVVIGEGMEDVKAASHPYKTAIQNPPQGTGDALRVGYEALQNPKGLVLMLYGDVPLITKRTLQSMIDKLRSTDSAIVVGAFQTPNPGSYGRIVMEGEILKAIVEAKDCSPAELQIPLCNSGIMVFDGKNLKSLLKKLDTDNAQNEYLATDCIKHAIDEGLTCRIVEMSEVEAQGINTPQDLAVAEQGVQNQLRRLHLLNGVRMVDPNTVYFSWDTEIGEGTTLEPNIFFGQGVKIGKYVDIKAFCHLEHCRVGDHASIGPFARLRPGTNLSETVKIGNFVELKNAQIAQGAKINHLSYVGDAVVGEKSNIGAGTITCNYDGVVKSQTTIGKNVFVGSNTTLIAPVSLADSAYVAAGTTVRESVPANTLTFNTIDQQFRVNWGDKNKKQKKKAS